jgi:threonine/homoserine/homoserine lactone efflux protein
MAYLAVLGASRGRLAGFSAVLGVAFVALLGIAVGLGGGSLVLNNRVVYESLRWAGALYLCWLAFDSWREARKPIEAVPVSPSHFIHFRRGFVTNLLTPKAAVFFIAELPEFTQGPPPARELALLVSVYVGIATLVHGLVVVPAGGLQMLFAAPQRRKMAGNIFAVLLLAIAVWLFVSGRR